MGLSQDAPPAPERATGVPLPVGVCIAVRQDAELGTKESDDENDVVIHRSKTARILIDSDEEDATLFPDKNTNAGVDDRSPDDNIVEVPSVSFNKISNKLSHADYEDNPTSKSYSNNPDTLSGDNEFSNDFVNKFPKRRVIRGLSESENEDSLQLNIFPKSDSIKELQERIRKAIGSESSSDDECESSKRNIRSKMIDKFKNRFKNSKKIKPQKSMAPPESENEIKTLKPWSSLCDKDTSSSDSNPDDPRPHLKSRRDFSKDKPNSNHKYEKKPKNMSARDAMENKTKIKSESNRMLREREVSLPYHRPKHITLQDILRRRKLAVGSDGKPLPLKMNDVQLKHYAQQLEERKKEMEELYKSDNEEEENEEHSNESKNNARNITNDTCVDNLLQTNNIHSALYIDASNDNNVKNGAKTNENEESINVESEKYSDNLFDSCTEVMALEKTEIPKTITQVIEEKADLPGNNSERIGINSEHSTNVDSQLIILNFGSENTNIACKESQETYNVTAGDYSKVIENISKDSNITNENAKSKSDNDRQVQNLDVNSLINTIPTSHKENEQERNQSTEAIVLTLNESDKSINEEHSTDRRYSDQHDKVKEIQYSFDDDFPDDDVDMSRVEEILNKIENGKDHTTDSPLLIKDVSSTNCIDDDMTIDLGWAPSSQRQTGVELLKQRFLYFSKMKTSDEQDREEWTKYKPGAQRFKLMQELEKQSEAQSAAEWAKRLEEENQKEQDLIELNGKESDSEDELEKLEKKCAEQEERHSVLEETGDTDKQEEIITFGEKQQNDDNDAEQEINEQEKEIDENKLCKHKKNKPLNTLIDDEAEVADGEYDSSDETASSDDESSSCEEEAEDEKPKPKKGRIAKAFEDSDDENDIKDNEDETGVVLQSKIAIEPTNDIDLVPHNNNGGELQTDSAHNVEAYNQRKTPDGMFASQSTQADEDFPLAQRILIPDDVNTSEEPCTHNASRDGSIQNSGKLSVLFQSQAISEVDLEAVVGLCSGKFPTDSPPVLPSINTMLHSDTTTQTFGDELLRLCSGQFDNHLVETQGVKNNQTVEKSEQKTKDHKHIQELLEELDEEEIKEPAKNKYFGINGGAERKEIRKEKGKLVLMSSDDEVEENEAAKNKKKRKKHIKRKLISDDEEEEVSEVEENASDEAGTCEDEDKIVDYDSEENEVVVEREAFRRRAAEFLEKEAELSSEEEWAGSGDEDERGPDRLEREAGDDDVFHEGDLRRELGVMHMQDMLEEDKREVRMLQEILLEDEDLVGPQRQRRFRWRDNEDAEEQSGAVTDMFGDTPVEEDESEAMWRKQRHERSMYLKKLAEEQKCNENEDALNLEVAPVLRTSIQSRSSTRLHVDEESINLESNSKTLAVIGKPPTRDPAGRIEATFSILQRHRGSFLDRDAVYLQRLASLAEPLAGAGAADEPLANLSALAPGKKRSFVFATLTPPPAIPDHHAKTSKRKAEGDTAIPKLIKKQRTSQTPKKSLLDFLD